MSYSLTCVSEDPKREEKKMEEKIAKKNKRINLALILTLK